MLNTITTGWKLDRTERDALLARFPPRWPDVDAAHVTLAARVPPDTPIPADTRGEIVGHVNDGLGLEAMVVRLGGTTDRPDGSIFHITWSLDKAAGRAPVESNAVLRDLGWRALERPVPVTLTGARLRGPSENPC